MSMKKRLLIVFLCMLTCLTAFPIPQVIATDVTIVTECAEVMPLMECIYDADHTLSISNEKAIVYAYVRGNSSKATKCKVTVELQEKGLLFWSSVNSWDTTEYGRSAELNASQGITSGKSYRIVTTVTVWSGTDSETQTITSDTIKA